MSEARKNIASEDREAPVPQSDVAADLSGNISRAGPRWIRNLYGSGQRGIIKQVRHKLKADDGRLGVIPVSQFQRRDIITSLVKVIATILQKSTDSGKTRKVVDSDGMDLRTQNGSSVHGSLSVKITLGKSSADEEKPRVVAPRGPAIAIEASGASFELPRKGTATLGYSNIATVFDVKLDEETDDDTAGVSEVESMWHCVREIFVQQPNRRFVRIVVITERRFRIIHYDRGGALYSPLIDYHKDTNIFIRAILSLTSKSEEQLGLDTSVQWEIRDGRKVSGTITTSDKTYDLQGVDPSFTRRDIHGRGTVCWPATDPDTGEDLLIKDAWLWEADLDDRKEEYYYLEKARGIPGIMQMKSFEDRKGRASGEIKCFRPPTVDSGETGFYNRIFRRIVLVKYGGDLDEFQSQLEFICALRDAIEAHGKLFSERSILHRDISSGNILLGLPGAPKGWRGILIDMDYAIEIPPDARGGAVMGGAVGTRLFQAYYVLKGSGLHEYRPVQDYLDDLESFFYVMYVLMHQYIGVGRTTSIPFELEWGSDNMDTSAEAKRKVLDAPELNLDEVPEFWSQPCKDVLVAFHEFVGEMVRAKEEFVGDMTKAWDNRPMLSLYEDFDEHYARVLAPFDRAIEALTPKPKIMLRIPLIPTTRANKRALERDDDEEEGDELKAKRLCFK